MDPYKFKPRARLIRTIGDKLVSGPIAAVVELVKNAHDADATHCTIKIISQRDEAPCVEISDDGHGMSFNTIINSWLEPATDHKVVRSHSTLGRKLLGSKGIGRFAAARLGELMTLTTAARAKDNTSTEVTTVKIDWKDFDAQNYLEDVRVQIRRSSKPNDHPTGTTVRIKELRDNWISKEISDLNIELRRLISPIKKETKSNEEQINKQDDFSIFLDLSESLESSRPLSFDYDATDNILKVEPAPILDSADYEVVGSFDNEGNFKGEMTFHSLGEPYSETINEFFPIDLNRGVLPCGDLKVRLLIFDREPESIEALITRAGLQGYGKRAARQILDDMTGVGIYRDDFRIRPYGDKDQDWLELSRRRVDNPSMRIGSNQIAGFITISEENNSNLIERSSREGLESNGSYKRLQELITNLLGSAIEPMRRKVREGTGKGKRKPRHEQFIEAAEFTWKEKILSEIPVQKREAARITIDHAQEELRKRIIEQIEHERILEARATLGKIIAEVLHELRNPLKSMSSLLKHLKFDWKKITSTEPEKDTKEKYLFRTEENIKQSARMEKLLSQLDPLATKRSGPPTIQNAYNHIISSIEVMNNKAVDNGISIHLEGEKNLNYLGYGDEIQTALINLIDNSIFWLIKQENRTPRINITTYKESGYILIRVEDNGPGIKDNFKESVFEAGFTTKVSHGQGLGLAISKESLARTGGSLKLVNAINGCTFEIKIKEASTHE
ncbi:ATP-binding protein [Pseudomonas sp. SWRI99]|uniref:ATP-binding protein n=1 Tax=Pseudomonas sp. SWRI99 TaxID=2745506 RepID=UPI00164950DE|nr:sensor histidine kinase [Pseudomonas sp. SWRI99]